LQNFGAIPVLARSFSARATGLLAMANVTKRNFEDAYEQLKGHLQKADFVAIDLEMTGVESTMWRRNLEMDTCETRYQNLKHSAEKFAVWQCGVCPFKWDETGKKFIAFPYNFFIFPRNELQLDMPSRAFFAQTTSLEFLAKHKFDFNTCVYDGISYLSRDQEAAARYQLGLGPRLDVRKQNIAEEHEIPLTRSGDVLFAEKIRVQVGEWRDGLLDNQRKWQWTDGGGGGGGVRSIAKPDLFSIPLDPTKEDPTFPKQDIAVGSGFGSLRPSLMLDTMSPFHSKVVKQVLRKNFHDLVGVMKDKGSAGGVTGDWSQIQVVFTSSKEDKNQLLEEIAQEEKRSLEGRVSEAVGFRKVIDAISESGLPVIGHNCILDMTHLHSKFMTPLPSSAARFSSSLQTLFPCIVDTKYLIRTEPTLRAVLANRSTSLAIVFSHICQGFANQAVASGRFYFGRGKILNTAFTKVAVEVAEDFRRYGGTKDTGLKHEAGFDAYMTGAVFAQACHLLQIDVATIQNLPQAVKQGDAGLASYANLLALGWVGNMALDLSSGKQATGVKAFHAHQLPANHDSDNSTVALVWGFPAGSREQDLLKMVQKMFKPERHGLRLEITLVDNSAAFIEFRNPAVMQQFFQLLQVPKTAHISISSDLRAAPFEAYEYLCKSPLSTELLADSAHILGLDQRFVEGCAMHHDTCGEMLPFPRSEEHFDPEMMPPVISQENSDTRHDPGFGKGQEIGSDFSESFDYSEGARYQLREEVLEIPEVDNSLVLENFERTFSVDRSLQLSNSKNLDTRQQFSPGSGIDNAIEKKDVSSVELKISSLMKRSFIEEQPVFSSPNLIKRSRTREPSDGSNV
jgi:poly(A)-specific ribonuclease